MADERKVRLKAQKLNFGLNVSFKLNFSCKLSFSLNRRFKMQLNTSSRIVVCQSSPVDISSTIVGKLLPTMAVLQLRSPEGAVAVALLFQFCRISILSSSSSSSALLLLSYKVS